MLISSSTAFLYFSTNLFTSRSVYKIMLVDVKFRTPEGRMWSKLSHCFCIRGISRCNAGCVLQGWFNREARVIYCFNGDFFSCYCDALASNAAGFNTLAWRRRHNLLRHVDACGFDKDRAYNDCGAISVSQER
jgi:hypothetical protein